MEKTAISCMLLVFSLVLIFSPAGSAEAFRGVLERAASPSTLRRRGSETPPAQPAPTQRRIFRPPAPEPSQPSNNSGSSRFSKSERRYTPVLVPPGGGTAVPSTPSVPVPDPAPTPPPPQQTTDVPAAPSWLNANEARGYTLLNETRMKNNLEPVNISYQLTEVARMKAKDMIDNNYFAHVSPTYGSIGTMLRNAGITFKVAAENLSKAGNITQCHLQLEYSTAGHRQVMLSSNYHQVGIAVLPLKSAPGILMVQIYTD